MRHLRWKRKYVTGNTRIDRRNKVLAHLLHTVDQEMRTKEHCQDMEELYQTLVKVAEERFSKGEAYVDSEGSDEAIRDLVRTSLPLNARDTPACRDCGICDLFQEGIMDWLQQANVSVQPGGGPMLGNNKPSQ